jgi:seryl-tRNA synthetase
MIDIQLLRTNPELVREKSAQKLVNIDTDSILKLDVEKRELAGKIDELRAKRNVLSDSMKNSKPTEAQIAEGRGLKDEIASLEANLEPIGQSLNALLFQVPNMPTDDTPVGASEEENQVIKTVGEVPVFEFTPKSDEELGKIHDLIDRDTAAEIAGSRFAYVKGPLVRLQFALLNFVMDVLGDQEKIDEIIKNAGLEGKVSNKTFTPVLPPPMLNTAVYQETARLNGSEVTYKLEGDDLWLNGSAEHSLCCMYRDTTLSEADLPLRFIGYGTAFRREAGTYGKDMEGLFRMHHFDKAEMESFTTADDSYNEHLFLVAVQEYLVSKICIPYRMLLKCTADIGTPNARGVDLEMWMPSQNKYRETHSADLITDYQTRRLKTRVKRVDGTVELAHTNDATAFAMGRTLKAIIENYQQADGSIGIPDVLKNYLGGKEKLC